MLKIDENIDLSKRVLNIDIGSPVFNCLLQDLNEEIQRCIKNVYEEKFEAGEISIKLTIEIPDDYKTVGRNNAFGELVNDTFKYRRPKFEHKITTTLKKRYKQEGCFTGEREVVFEDGKFITVPLKNPQVTIEDLEKE